LNNKRQSGASYRVELKKVVSLALQELGLDFKYLQMTLQLPHNDIDDLEGTNLSAYSWIVICQTLYLHLDTCRWGYHQRSHHAKLYQAWMTEGLNLPQTPRLQSLIEEFKLRKTEEEQFYIGLRTFSHQPKTELDSYAFPVKN